MKSDVLKEIKIMLNIDNKRYDELVNNINTGVLNNSIQNELIDLIVNSFKNDKRVFSTVKEGEEKLEVFLQRIGYNESLTINQFYTVLWRLHKQIKDFTAIYYVNNIIKKLKTIASKMDDSTLKNCLLNINDNSRLRDKKSAIVNFLQELNIIVRTKTTKSYKNIEMPKKVKEDISLAIDMMKKCNDALLDDSTFNYKSLNDEINDCLDSFINVYNNKSVNKTMGSSLKLRKIPKKGLINSSLVSRNKLIDEQTSDKSKKRSNEKVGKKKILMWVAGALVIVTIGTAMYNLGRNSQLKDDEQDDKKNDSDVEVENPIEEESTIVEGFEGLSEEEQNAQIILASKNIYDNWKSMGLEYTQDEIMEIIRCFNGLSSSINIQDADDVILNVLNKAMEPAINNGIIGENQFKTLPIDLSDLLISKKSGYVELKSLNDDLNYAIENTIRLDQEFIKKIYLKNIKLAILQQNVNGLKIGTSDDSTPEYELLYSRMAIAINGIIGSVQTKDMIIKINGENYSSFDIIDYEPYEKIATNSINEIMGPQKILIKK